MSLRQLLFPPESRLFPGQRWLNIGLRTLHLIGLAGVGGGYFYAVADQRWLGFLYLTLGSGLVLMLLSLWSNAIWLVQLRGQAILLKLLLLVLIPFWPEQQAVLMVVVIVISGLVSHAPGDVRYYSLFHGRRIERL
ncbi:hypothetical protein ACFL0R_01950 [Pseudomonadota bacterium]